MLFPYASGQSEVPVTPLRPTRRVGSFTPPKAAPSASSLRALQGGPRKTQVDLRALDLSQPPGS